MIKGSVLFNGQYTFGLTAGAPISTNESNALVSGISNSETTSTTATACSTTGTTLLTITPVSGTYLAIFSGNVTASSAGGNVLTVVLNNGNAITASTRTALPLSSAAVSVFQNMTVTTNAIITVNGSQAISVVGTSSAGTVTVTQRTLDLIRIG
jgi:hypothetical protein